MILDSFRIKYSQPRDNLYQLYVELYSNIDTLTEDEV